MSLKHKSKNRILIFCSTTQGGLAEHIFYQARSLSKLGYSIMFLAPEGYLTQKVFTFPIRHVLFKMPRSTLPWFLKRFLQMIVLCANYYILAYFVLVKKPVVILFDSYAEYLAPLWSWAIKSAVKVSKSVCAVNLHDPVRDYVVGPKWWHTWSVKCAYSFINIGLVHGPVPVEAEVPPRIMLIEVPVGIYDLPLPTTSREVIRKQWSVKPNQHVLLSFGFIRDNKNIDLLIRALPLVKEAFLVIAGNTQSTNDRPMEFYRLLARQLLVSDRCFFLNGFVEENKIGNFFAGSDLIALTYSSTFHSQSGVLNLAASSKLPVLASAAESPLTKAIRQYNLGVVIKPDSVEAIVEGINQLLNKPREANWRGYYEYAGWESNVNKLCDAVKALNKAP